MTTIDDLKIESPSPKVRRKKRPLVLRSPERKRDVWEDMKKVRALLQEPGDDE